MLSLFFVVVFVVDSVVVVAVVVVVVSVVVGNPVVFVTCFLKLPLFLLLLHLFLTRRPQKNNAGL